MGSEMCIRDRHCSVAAVQPPAPRQSPLFVEPGIWPSGNAALLLERSFSLGPLRFCGTVLLRFVDNRFFLLRSGCGLFPFYARLLVLDSLRFFVFNLLRLLVSNMRLIAIRLRCFLPLRSFFRGLCFSLLWLWSRWNGGSGRLLRFLFVIIVVCMWMICLPWFFLRLLCGALLA